MYVCADVFENLDNYVFLSPSFWRLNAFLIMGRLEFPSESLDALRRLRGTVTEWLSGGVRGGWGLGG